MKLEEIRERFTEILSDQLDIPETKIAPEMKFREDLRADSLDLLELIMECEDDFEISITDEEAEGIATVQEAIDFLYEKVRSS